MHLIDQVLGDADDPGRIVLRWRDETLTNADLRERVARLAGILMEAPPDTVVGLRMDNQPAFIVAFLACLRAARPAVLFDPHWTEVEEKRARAIVQVSLTLCTGEVRGFDPELRLDPLGGVLSVPDAIQPTADNGLRGVAVVHWSSGSTGTPKPIPVSFEALDWRVRSLVDAYGLAVDDTMLCFVPLSHCHGLDCISLPTLAAGAELALLEPTEATPLRVIREIRTRGITAFSAFPTFYERLVRQDVTGDAMSGVRLPLCGSAALRPGVADRFWKRFGIPVRIGYGLTEVGVICLTGHGERPEPFDTVGSVLQDIEWRIDDPDEDGVGELWVRSPGSSDGYLEHADAGRAFLEGDWLRTRDLVRSDGDGRLYIVGRMSAFVNVAGAKVDPREVEATIEELPWVEECAVAGRSVQGRERVVAFVVVLPTAAPGRIEDEVRRHVAERLSVHKVPDRVVSLPGLPRSTLGKVLYAQLRLPDTVATENEPDEFATDAHPVARGDVERAVAEIWCEVLELDRVGVDDRFTDVGGESVMVPKLLGKLRERFDIDLQLVDLFRYPTVRAQAEAVCGITAPEEAQRADVRGQKQREALQRHASRRDG